MADRHVYSLERISAMKRIRHVVPVMALAASIGATVPLRNDPPPCAPLDERTSDILADYRWLDTTSDSETIAWRESVSLPKVAVDQIELVNESSVCRRALVLYNKVLADSVDARGSTSATVIKWGRTRYAVSDTVDSEDEAVEIVTDTAFTRLFGLSRR
jgi:hypothetical protein